MTKNELIKFGQNLVDKGRSAIEIRNSLLIKADGDKEMLNEILKEVFQDEPRRKKSPEAIRKLLKANKLKLNHEYSQRGNLRIAYSLLVIGFITYYLSSNRVNQNEIFGWFTIGQGAISLALFYLVKRSASYELLLPILIIYVTILGIELILFGIPNDLLKAYYSVDLYVPPSYKLNVRSGGARLIGYLFPYLYTCLKFFLGFFIFKSYWNYKQYDNLHADIKAELTEL